MQKKGNLLDAGFMSHHCLFNAIDPVGDANRAESCEITAIGSVLKNVKNVGWLQPQNWANQLVRKMVVQDGRESLFELQSDSKVSVELNAD